MKRLYPPFWRKTHFYTHEAETILVKIGISEVDVADARRLLAEEFPGWDFKQARSESERIWKR